MLWQVDCFSLISSFGIFSLYFHSLVAFFSFFFYTFPFALLVFLYVDYSAFFCKNGRKLNRYISDDVIIVHSIESGQKFSSYWQAKFARFMRHTIVVSDGWMMEIKRWKNWIKTWWSSVRKKYEKGCKSLIVRSMNARSKGK